MGSRREASLSVGALLGEPRGGLLFWRSGRILKEGTVMKITHRGGTNEEFGRVLVYQVFEKTLEMATFLHRGSVTNRGQSIHR
jgi:hypothetical protein